ncbi:hypothetical protein F2Q69_00004023 [Brassica cretica]|uniref:Uncharacterized protein n=1 Tax=Brassica cretica TaxID=69181 RepID=A0A8S9PHL3_BRACR|nr:hypothetical protein F2Q69_00004023 [Brassica cretica]
MKEKHANDPQKINRWEVALKSVTERIGLSTEVYGTVKTTLAYISQLSHITIWDDKENHNKQPGPLSSGNVNVVAPLDIEKKSRKNHTVFHPPNLSCDSCN